MATVALFDAYPEVLGGAQRAMIDAGRALRERGWNVEVLLPGEGAVAAAARDAGLPCAVVAGAESVTTYRHRTDHLYGRLAMARALPSLWRRMARHLRLHADVVHVNDHRGLVLGGVAARLAGRPLVWHVHSIVDAPRVDGLGVHLASAIVVPSHWAAAQLPARGTRRRLVLPSPLPSWTAAAGPARPHGHDVVCLGRLHPDKGIDVVIDAAAALRERVPDARVHVYGDASPNDAGYRRDLADRAARRGVDGYVVFHGAVDRADEALAGATVAVQPSRRETQGLAALEAMACGVPVVATRTGGVPEYVEDGVSGLLVAPDDPGALARALGDVLTDDALAARLRAGGKVAAARVPTRAQTTDELIALYDSLLGRR